MAATRIQHRRGTAEAWLTANPVLEEGELGLETDTGIIRFGNGTLPWADLAPSAQAAISPTAAEWQVRNPILGDGIAGIERDTKKIKVGDGVTPWNNLAYTDASVFLTKDEAVNFYAPITVTNEKNPLTGWYHVDQFGALGDGVANDLPSVQAAVTSALAEGRPETIYFPDPEDHYAFGGSLQLGSQLTLRGNGRGVGGSAVTDRLIIGNGVVPVFVTGIYPNGSSANSSDIKFEGIGARNHNAPVVELLTALNFTIDFCNFASYTFANVDSGAVKGRYSYRGSITNSRIGASGGAWGIDLRDNCNGITIEKNILSGGSAGGAVNVGQSQSVHVLRNIIETSLVGIVLAAAGTNSGRCIGCTISGNYLENVQRPISAGTGFAMQGGSIRDNFISNGSSTFTPEFGLEIGRLGAVSVINNGGSVKASEPWIKVIYVASAVGSTPAPEGCQILGNQADGVTAANLYDLTSYSNEAARARFAGLNVISTSVGGTQPNTGYREYISPLITANVAFTSLAIGLDTTFGGIVDGVDIIDATGTLNCTVQLGTATAQNEIASFDPATLTLVGRAATVDLNSGWRSATQMLLRVLAGTGTGTFRVRVRWQGR